MTTIRVQKHERNFTIIQNEAIQDKSLSLKARGLHHLLLSYPNDWVINVKHLSSQSDKDGPDAIRTGLKELEGCGYLKRDQSRNSGKFGQADYVVYEVSQNHCKQGDSTVSGFSDDGLAGDGKSGDILSTIPTKTFSTKDSYRTVPSSTHTEKSVFDSSDQGEPEGNCTTTLANPSSNGHAPNSQNGKCSGSSKKPNKPRKRKLFDGSTGLSRDRNGWIELPKAIDTAPEYRELIGLVNAQVLVWTKVWCVGRFPDQLGLTPYYDYEKNVLSHISGADFDVMPYSEFLGKDGPVPVKVMRDVLEDRIDGFQEHFNDQVNEYFWSAWNKYTKESA